ADPMLATIAFCSDTGGKATLKLPTNCQSARGIFAPKVELLITSTTTFVRRNCVKYGADTIESFGRNTKNSPTHTPADGAVITFAKYGRSFPNSTSFVLNLFTWPVNRGSSRLRCGVTPPVQLSTC